MIPRRCWLFLSVLLAVLMVGAPLSVGRGEPIYAGTSPHLGYGIMVAFPPGHLGLVTDMGFDWYKYFLYWYKIQPTETGGYDWTWLDWRLQETADSGLNLILRVEGPPSWARAWDHYWAPVRHDKMTAWREFFRATAEYIAAWQESHGTSFRVALEVWNEPNLSFQWGDQPVDPAWYTEMVRYAYEGAKAGDPNIIVVAGGLAPTGGTSDGMAMDDVKYLEAMYDAGLAGHFDVISTHNYGFGGPPEDKDWGYGILNFRRAEDIYQVMVAHGDGDKPVWATEFGWLLDSDERGVECDPEWEAWGFAWQQVSAQQQADYLVRAFQYADANWDWMGVMVVSNLDFNTTGWYATCDPLNWFSILETDGSPRPAYTALQGMTKRYRSWEAWGMDVRPPSLAWMMPLTDTRRVTRAVSVLNTGMHPFTWTVTTSTQGLPFSVSPLSGTADGSFQVVMDARGLTTGTYTGRITVTASATEVQESPFVVPLTLHVVPRVYNVSLPIVVKGLSGP
ncbi:MAG TPA: hypothetical protein G4O00_05320 [Thermoflexia bacterium]|nr:hypothetical protein [Thermoflexia bacterium]